VDGLLLFVILWLFARQPRPRWATGALYCGLYGCARFVTEYFRTPDWQVEFLGLTISSGQILSLPMIVVGAAVFIWAYRNQSAPEPVVESTVKKVSPKTKKVKR
jgi:phosphatidylglycerol---prolipoprotein diacylglyceryl transferase